MKKITAADLLRLDFEQVDVSQEDGWDEGFSYFVFKLKSEAGYPLLITGGDDENDKKDEYSVEINELDDVIIIKDLDDLESLVDIIKRNIKNE